MNFISKYKQQPGSSGIKRPNTWHYLKITLLVFGIAGLWQSMHSLILPLRILDFVPEAQKNTYLGLLTFSGLIIAMLVQPIAGAISDRSTLGWGRRRPFIFTGILAIVVLLPIIGAATSFTLLFIGYCLLQLASNTAQGPYQAFIPETVPRHSRGRASGIKSLLEILGAGALLFPVSRLMDNYAKTADGSWLWIALLMLGSACMLFMLFTVISVKEPRPEKPLKTDVLPGWIKSFSIDIKSNRPFMWFLISRLAVFMGLATVQQFALYFFRDVAGVPEPAMATTNFLAISIVFMLIAVLPAGYFSDRIGRKSIAICSAFCGAIGILVILINQSFPALMLAASILGLSLGAFTSTNWALATDLVARGEEAKYLGIANMATAGGGALARLIGPVIDYFNQILPNLGYFVMLGACMAYFIAGGLILFKVKVPRFGNGTEE